MGKHSEGECDTLVVEHVLHTGVMENGIVNFNATCHMCHDEMLFSELQLLKKETDITLHCTDYFNEQNHFTTTCLWHSHAL